MKKTAPDQLKALRLGSGINAVPGAAAGKVVFTAAEAEKQRKLISDWVKRKLSGNYVKIADDFYLCKFRNGWISSNRN